MPADYGWRKGEAKLNALPSFGEQVGEAMKPLADDVQSAVIPGAGHWFAEEAPEETLAALVPFLAPYRHGEGADKNTNLRLPASSRFAASRTEETHMSVTTERRESTTAIRPFRVDIPDEALDDLRRRIASTRWPEKEPVDNQSQGVGQTGRSRFMSSPNQGGPT
jgi:hypothetical protein